MMALEQHATDDIPTRDRKGQTRYVQFVKDRLLKSSPMFGLGFYIKAQTK